MKKYIIIVVALFFSLGMLTAQDAFDVTRMSSYDLKGSARYVSMGGAFSALGGDASALQDNPAGLGVFRSSEVALSLNYDHIRTRSLWNGDVGYGTSDFFTANQVDVVLNLSEAGKNTGLVSHSFAFGYNRLKSFNRSVFIRSDVGMPVSLTDNISAYTNLASGLVPDDFSEDKDAYRNDNIGWLSVLGFDAGLMEYDTDKKEWHSAFGVGTAVAPKQKLSERGYIDQYALAWGGNIDNRYYIGVGLNFLNSHYAMNAVYGETISGTNENFTIDSYLRSDGVGFNANFGIIVRPLDFWRMGVAIQTPTVWSTTDYSNSSVGRYQTPDAYVEYRMNTPLKLNVGTAFVLGKRGLISLEYEYNNVRNTNLRTYEGDMNSYSYENQDIKDMFMDVHKAKVGAEVWVIPNLALRAGYVYTSALTKNNAVRYKSSNAMRADTHYSITGDMHYASAGLGYRTNFFFVDLAYQYRIANEQLYPFENLSAEILSPIDVQMDRHSMVLSFGFRF